MTSDPARGAIMVSKEEGSILDDASAVDNSQGRRSVHEFDNGRENSGGQSRIDSWLSGLNRGALCETGYRDSRGNNRYVDGADSASARFSDPTVSNARTEVLRSNSN